MIDEQRELHREDILSKVTNLRAARTQDESERNTIMCKEVLLHVLIKKMKKDVGGAESGNRIESRCT